MALSGNTSMHETCSLLSGILHCAWRSCTVAHLENNFSLKVRNATMAGPSREDRGAYMAVPMQLRSPQEQSQINTCANLQSSLQYKVRLG